MDEESAATSQVDQGGGQQVGGRCQGDELGNAKPASAREATVAEQPAVGCSDHRADECAADQKLKGAKNLIAAIGAQLEKVSFRGLKCLAK